MGLPSAVASLALEALAAVLAPPRCAACDEPVGRRAVFCGPCASTAEHAGGDGAGGFAAFVYGGAVARAIARMKYESRPDLARPLGDLLCRALESRSEALDAWVVVPVPLHPSRLAERGFNQSALLARRVARHFELDVQPLALKRLHDTPKQANLDRQARLANVAGAFVMRRGQRVSQRAVLLVDDVSTTGATLGACARALREGGARAVTTAVVARA